MPYDYRLVKFYNKEISEFDESLISQLNASERYLDLTEIASGGMKKIYKAFDQKSERYIAYAVLKGENTPEVKEIFIKEARLTAKLNHPNIIPIYNIGLDHDQNPYFTMELKIGDSLQDIINKIKKGNKKYTDKYDLLKFLSIFIKICDAIDFAHSKKVVHLDIKPENIQVGQYGEVIVCDWGLSKIYEQQADTEDINQQFLNPEALNTETLHGEIKGTPGFMAPEQISGEKKTPKTDIFSLGCLLYYLLHNHAPFEGDDLREVLTKTIVGEYFIDDKVPHSIQAILDKTMAVSPKERYQSVNDLKHDIENFMQGYATLAEEASSLKLLKLFFLRNKTLSIVSFVFVTVALLGTYSFVKSIQEEKEKAKLNLKLFIEQKEETEKAQKDYYSALIDQESKEFHSNFQDNPLQSHQRTVNGLEKLIKAYPKYSEAKSALGYHLFVCQKFNEAEKYLQEAPGSYAEFLPYIQKFKNLKTDSEILSSKDFSDLLKEIKPFRAIHLKMLMVQSSQYKNPKASLPAVKYILEQLNPEWNSEGLSYNHKNEQLTISGQNFKNLSFSYSKYSPLGALRIKSLTLRGTDIRNLKPLIETSVQKLDISNTKIPFHNLYKNQPKALTKLIISPQQYEQRLLLQLPKIIDIESRP